MKTCGTCVVIAGLQGDLVGLEKLLKQNSRIDHLIVLQTDMTMDPLRRHFTDVKHKENWYLNFTYQHRLSIEMHTVRWLQQGQFHLIPSQCSHLRDPNTWPLEEHLAFFTLYELIIGYANPSVLDLLLRYTDWDPVSRSIDKHSYAKRIRAGEHIPFYIKQDIDSEPNPLLVAIMKSKPDHLAVFLNLWPSLLDLPIFDFKEFEQQQVIANLPIYIVKNSSGVEIFLQFLEVLVAAGFDVNQSCRAEYGASILGLISDLDQTMLAVKLLIRKGLMSFILKENGIHQRSLVQKIGSMLKKREDIPRHWTTFSFLIRVLTALGLYWQLAERDLLRCELNKNQPFDWPFRIGSEFAVKEVADIREQSYHNLRLVDFVRISIRKTIGGVHFQRRVEGLPLPPQLKDFVLAF